MLLDELLLDILLYKHRSVSSMVDNFKSQHVIEPSPRRVRTPSRRCLERLEVKQTTDAEGYVVFII